MHRLRGFVDGSEHKVPRRSRPLTVSERYYAFLDAVTPMNVIMAADLDRCLPVEDVERGWQAFVERRCLPRLRVGADMTLYDGAPESDFGSSECPSGGWDAAVAADARQPFGLDRAMRCRYLRSPDEDRARLYYVVHHAVTDGRGGLAELQALLRLVDGQPVPEQAELPVPGAMRTPRWQSDRRAYIDLLQAIRHRNEEAGAPQPHDWKQPDALDRVPRFQSMFVESDVAAGLRGRVRGERGTVYTATAAAWLCSIAETLLPGEQPTMQLATSIDLAKTSADVAAARSAVVGVIANRFRVEPDAPWALSRQIRERMAASMRAGEAELFFRLARVESAGDIAAGTAIVARALAEAPPAVSFTDMGVVDPGSDPEWVHALYGYLPAAPNQMVSAACLEYRGALPHSVMTADLQLPPSTAESVASAYAARIRAMALE